MIDRATETSFTKTSAKYCTCDGCGKLTLQKSKHMHRCLVDFRRVRPSGKTLTKAQQDFLSKTGK